MMINVMSRKEILEMVKLRVDNGLKDIYGQMREIRERIADVEVLIKRMEEKGDKRWEMENANRIQKSIERNREITG